MQPAVFSDRRSKPGNRASGKGMAMPSLFLLYKLLALDLSQRKIHFLTTFSATPLKHHESAAEVSSSRPGR